jgi:hypothetical protein
MIIKQFGYAHATPAIPALGSPEGPLQAYDDGLLLVHGFHVEVLAFGGENHYTYAEGGMQGGSLHCALIQVQVDGPVEVTTLEGRSGDESRFFAAFLELLPDTAPPTDDPSRMSLRAAVRREVRLIPELAHVLGDGEQESST